MNVLQAVTAIFRSPEAAVLVAQAVQASDLAARQGQASIHRDAARRQDQVAAAESLGPSEKTGPKQAQEQASQRKRNAPGKPTPDAPLHRRGGRLDITA